jgi:hypothetical protein
MHLALLHSTESFQHLLHKPMFSSDTLKLAADCFKYHRCSNKNKAKKMDAAGCNDTVLYNEAVTNCSILFDFPDFEHTSSFDETISCLPENKGRLAVVESSDSMFS